MSRSKRRDLTTIVAVAITLAAALVLVGSAKVLARTDVSCWWTGGILNAVDLPDRPFAVTFSRIPSGTTLTSPDGTYSQDVSWKPVGTEAVFWTRGGGGALFKPGAQYNDYHPICITTRTE